jgi:CBS domain-containing protein
MQLRNTARMVHEQQSLASGALFGQLESAVSAMNTNLRLATDLGAAHLREVAMQVGDILRKKTARVATVRMNETVAIAAQLMRASNISALVVKDVVRTEGNTAVGMFTERDVVRAIAEHGPAGVNLKVSQLISVPQLVSCGSADTLEHVHRLMNTNHIRHVPVIDNYSLIGVISIGDISTAFEDEAAATRSVPA